VRIRQLEERDRDVLFAPRVRCALGAWLERQERDEIYVAVAEVGSVPVGRVGLDFAAQGEVGVVYLWAASVEEEWRGQGIGTALMQHLEEVARERDRRSIELLVAQDNEPARRLYERLGYEVCGTGVNRWVERDDSGAEEFAELCWRMRKRLVDE
jgi:ribosomal protein S18 acetylase RimI-like enzyme